MIINGLHDQLLMLMFVKQRLGFPWSAKNILWSKHIWFQTILGLRSLYCVTAGTCFHLGFTLHEWGGQNNNTTKVTQRVRKLTSDLNQGSQHHHKVHYKIKIYKKVEFIFCTTIHNIQPLIQKKRENISYFDNIFCFGGGVNYF